MKNTKVGCEISKVDYKRIPPMKDVINYDLVQQDRVKLVNYDPGTKTAVLSVTRKLSFKPEAIFSLEIGANATVVLQEPVKGDITQLIKSELGITSFVFSYISFIISAITSVEGEPLITPPMGVNLEVE